MKIKVKILCVNLEFFFGKRAEGEEEEMLYKCRHVSGFNEYEYDVNLLCL